MYEFIGKVDHARFLKSALIESKNPALSSLQNQVLIFYCLVSEFQVASYWRLSPWFLT